MAAGRPRTFDTDTALDAALDVFWRKGYEGASLTDLTAAMGINRPSLYAAFGNKEDLFRKALDRYGSKMTCFSEALNEPVVRVAIETLLYKLADAQTNPNKPQGCLAVSGALACGEEADPIRRELNARRAASETAIRQRLEFAKANGDLPASAQPSDLARYITSVSNGMAVQAAAGATREELRRVVSLAMNAWPV